MKTTWISVVGLALAAPLFGQTDLDTIAQLRQIQIIPLGSPVSAIPSAGEVAPISGKPYCGIARTVEYSPDGKHVDRSESNHVCRDEQGRTRREVNGGKIISIVDPVASLAYSLQTETKTAIKRTIAAVQPPNTALQLNTAPINLKILNQPSKVIYETLAKLGGINVLFDPEITPPIKDQFSLDLSNTTLEQALNSIAGMTRSYWRPLNSNTIFITDDVPIKRAAAPPLQTAPPHLTLVEAAREQAQRMSSGGRGNGGNPVNVTVDDLGTQMVNGVKAQGVRTTSVIPTGTVGNDHEIKSASERWVSEDLHVLVKSIYTDSRTGSTVYDLINISEGPPDRSLFQVPNGYTLQEGGRGGRGGPMPGGGR